MAASDPPVAGFQSYAAREAALLAPYAVASAQSTGRKHAEPEHPYRSPFQRDRDRIVHSAAFRRLAYKTQVFTGEMGDYHRTRLTHTLEVASIARTVARALRLNEDLTEALALAHDIGHPPFGHAGEEVLDECLSDAGGFNHNRQALRIVELLETRYPEFPGLNLSREVLEGQAHRARPASAGRASEKLSNPLLEVQVVDAADSLTYGAHDADDALTLGLLEFDDLDELSLWAQAEHVVRERYAALSGPAMRRAVVRQLIDIEVGDLLEATASRLAAEQIHGVDDVRRAAQLVAPSAEVGERKAELDAFLLERVYRHPRVLAKRAMAQQALGESFAVLRDDPALMQRDGPRAAHANPVRAIADYLASLTDHSAWDEHARLTRDRSPGGR